MNALNEEWKPIDWLHGIPKDKYMISSMGRVKNTYTDRILENLLHTTQLYYYTIITNSRRGSKYKKDPNDISMPCKSRILWISSAVATAFIPTPYGIDPKYLVAYHIDDDPLNNSIDNLEWRFGTHRDTAMRPDERKRLLELIVQYNSDMGYSIAKTAQVIREQHGMNVTAPVIQALIRKNPDGSMCSNHWELLGVNPKHVKSSSKGFTEEQLRFMCKALCENKGAVTKTLRYLESVGIRVSSTFLSNLKNKYSHIKISDQYFEYDARGKFVSLI